MSWESVWEAFVLLGIKSLKAGKTEFNFDRLLELVIMELASSVQNSICARWKNAIVCQFSAKKAIEMG